jgi:hypothetical protein
MSRNENIRNINETLARNEMNWCVDNACQIQMLAHEKRVEVFQVLSGGCQINGKL